MIARKSSAVWSFPQVVDCASRPGVFSDLCFFDSDEWWILHNLPLLHSRLVGSQSFLFAGELTPWPDTFAFFLVSACAGALLHKKVGQLPVNSFEHSNFVLSALTNSTKGLAKCGRASEATEQVLQILGSMSLGNEAAHLANLHAFLDLRGSDVRLDSGSILEAARQAVPYPAFAWQWQCIQSYAWTQPQHINVLELLAFFNFLRQFTAKSGRSVRFYHVLDSRVCSCVLAKGRSSSKLLNRIPRRIAAVLLASDAYCFPLWTISSWNFADVGSRSSRPPDLDA